MKTLTISIALSIAMFLLGPGGRLPTPPTAKQEKKENCPSPTSEKIRLGNENEQVCLKVTISQGKYSNIFFIPHDDENVASAAVHDHIKNNGGTLIELKHSGAREITYTNSFGCSVKFDPNRMFSREGLEKSVKVEHRKNEGRHEPMAEMSAIIDDITKKLVEKVTAKLEGHSPIIGVHNNDNDNCQIIERNVKKEKLCIRWYSEKGKGERLEKDGGEEAVRLFPGNPNIINLSLKDGGNDPVRFEEDLDNYFLVTGEEDFNNLKGRYNVVLQANEKNSTHGSSPVEDGSLSVFLKKKRYIVIEAQGKRFNEQNKKDITYKGNQMKMLEDLELVIAGKKLPR